MNFKLRMTLALSLGISSLLQAQTWRSKLYPVDWKPQGNFYTDKIIQDFSYAGYWRGEKQIPTLNTNIKNVTLPPYSADKTGATDVTTKIQKAIDDVSAAGGGIVYLPAGTYKMSPGSNNSCLRIGRSNVILRGDGPGSTFIFNSSYQMAGKSIISVQGAPNWYGTTTNQTAISVDLTGPTRMIPVQNASGYQKGDLVVLRNTITDQWINEHKMQGIWTGYGSNLKGLAFCREVMAVDVAKNTITIDAPIRYTLLKRDNSTIAKVTGMISEVGIENLSIGNAQHPKSTGYGEEDYKISGSASADCHNSYALNMGGVVNGWINNVGTYQPKGNTSTAHILSNGIFLNQCKNVTVQKCHFQRPQYGGGGGNGYMYRVSGSENLIKNSIAEFNRHGFVFSSMNASGNVVHNCVDKNSQSATGASGYYRTSGSGSDHHMHFSTSNLIDQCTVINSYFAAGYRNYGGNPKHGITAAHSVFWNTSSSGTKFKQIVHTEQGRYGYAIGTSGSVTTVNTAEFSGKGTSAAITAPLDHVEGTGTGTNLVPQSLYLDQLANRTKPSPCANNALPNVTLTSPTSTATAPARIVLNAKAIDIDGTISKIEIYQGTTLLGASLSGSYTLTTPSLGAGNYSFTAKTMDNCSGTAVSSVVNVSLTSTPNALPTVSITSPINGSSRANLATITISAVAKDANGTISKVEFYQGTTLLGIEKISPYTFPWTPSAAGTYTITAKAFDNLSASRTSAPVVIKVNAPANQLPFVTLTAPATAIAPGPVTLRASADDNDGNITKVEFYQGNVYLGTSLTKPYTYTWSGMAAGNYSLTAKAYDNANGTKSSTAVTISITAPTTQTVGINGPSCVASGVANKYTLVPDAHATSGSWWISTANTITVDPTNFKNATVRVHATSGAYVLSCGVNFSSSPYYKEYTKTIKIGNCAARELEVTITPYPAEESSVIKSESNILEIKVLNMNGQQLTSTSYRGELEVTFAPTLPADMYLLQVVTQDGVQTKPYLKVN